MDLDDVISRALIERLGFSIVRPNQRKSIKAFLEGNDVFVSLPMGSGKSLAMLFCHTPLMNFVVEMALLPSSYLP